MIITDYEFLIESRERGYQTAPVSAEIYADILTPVQAYKKLCGSGASLLFESAEGGERQARYSFIAFNPEAEIFIKDGVFTMTGAGGYSVESRDPDGEIKKIIASRVCPACENLPPFFGGLAGYFCYEYYKYGEKIDMPSGSLGDARLFLFNEVVAFDNFRRKIVITVNVKLGGDLSLAYALAVKRLEKLCRALRSGLQTVSGEELTLLTPFSPDYSMEEYCKKVERAKEYIYEGDIFQCVPANRWRAKAKGSLFNAYRVMRVKNPSPYMIYLRADGVEIAGASPETLVKVGGGRVQTFPIAGTRRRGKTAAEDDALERELKADIKENAEHDMLVDLGRNDLGKVCKFGSVVVEDYKKICRYSHVMHVTSCVSGELCEGLNAVDALRATLPAGTLSGAPKKRAVEIIRELEENKPRGIYGGAVGYIGFSGDGDFCIAIRTAVSEGGEITVQAGGGVVIGSVPESEFKESENKSAAAREAIGRAAEADL